MLSKAKLHKTNSFLFIFSLVFSILFIPTSSSASQDGISGCVKKKTGVLRISQKCKKSEYAIAWNFSGPAGPKGDKGDPGETTRVSLGGGGQGPTGPQGPVGPTGPQGPSGTNSSMIWLSPQEMVLTGPSSTFSVVEIDLGDPLFPPFKVNALEFDAFDVIRVFRSLPKGWENSNSITLRIYWISLDNSGTDDTTFYPELYAGYVESASELGSAFATCLSPQCPYEGEGTISSGYKKLNIISITRTSFDLDPTDGGMIALSLGRDSLDVDEDGIADLGDSQVAYVLGVSISANIS